MPHTFSIRLDALAPKALELHLQGADANERLLLLDLAYERVLSKCSGRNIVLEPQELVAIHLVVAEEANY